MTGGEHVPAPAVDVGSAADHLREALGILNSTTKRVAQRFYYIDVSDVTAVVTEIELALRDLENGDIRRGTAQITAAGVEALRVAQLELDRRLEEEAAP